MPRERRYVELGKDILDKTILDRDDRYVGKVDDLLLELVDSAEGPPEPPVVTALVSGPLALAHNLPRPFLALARAAYRLIGLADPRPIEIPWERISTVDVAVHVDSDRRGLGAMVLPDAVDGAIISRLPGAGIRP